MSLLTTIFLVIFIIVILTCWYQGFLRSMFIFLAFCMGCILAFLFSPLLSKSLVKNDFVRSTLISFTDGSDIVAEEDVDFIHLPISQISADNVQRIIDNADMPIPIGEMLEKNIYSEAFKDDGITQFTDYMSYTFAAFTIHVVAFWVIFLLIFLLGIIATAIIDHVSPFLVMRRFDSLAACGVGVLLTIGLFFAIAMFIPVMLFMMGNQVPMLYELVDASKIASFFYEYNFFFAFLRSSW